MRTSQVPDDPSGATLAKQFVVRDVSRSRVNLGVPTGYLMIVPVEAA